MDLGVRQSQVQMLVLHSQLRATGHVLNMVGVSFLYLLKNRLIVRIKLSGIM